MTGTSVRRIKLNHQAFLHIPDGNNDKSNHLLLRSKKTFLIVNITTSSIIMKWLTIQSS